MVSKVTRGEDAQIEAGQIKGLEWLLNEIDYVSKKIKT
jgi:hypothetical protein